MLVLLALCAASCSGPELANAPVATSVAPTPIASGANGKLVPRQFVELGVKSSGAVAEVLAREGEQVQIGQTLARLDDTLFKLAVEEARLKLEQAGLDSEKAQKPADPVELAAAEKKIQAAQVALVNARGTLSTTVDSAQSALRSAQLAFDYAEADYNHQLDLKQWGIDVEVRVNALQASRVRYDNARADLEIARRDVSGAGIRASQAIVEAQKTLASAQADYDVLKKQPEPEKVRTAQLAVESAKVALAQAEADLQETTLVAPITGMVVEVNLKVGQQVGPGVTLITLADTSTWLVETANLTELSVVDINPGSRAICKFDAVPGLRLPGRVERIALRGQDQRGDVIYTVHVALDEMDSRLRWGMTAFVQFEK
jgi:multidrug resistance efflux pump